MGWFLRKRTGARGRPARPAAAGGQQQAAPTRGALRLLAVVAMVPLALLGWRRAERFLWHYAGAGRSEPVALEQVVLADAPPWLDPLVLSEVRQLVALQLTTAPDDHRQLEAAVLALRQSTWVEQVRQVVRRPEGGALVRATYRQPVAVVDWPDGCFRVDRHGVQLPGLFIRERLKGLNLPLVVGVGAAPRGEGRPWPGKDLAGGLALVEALGGQYGTQIEAIDVSDRDAYGRPRLVLHTRQGMVRWGLPPGEGEPIEPDADTKLRRLAQVQHHWQTIDAGGRIVELYGPAVFIRGWENQERAVQAAYPR